MSKTESKTNNQIILHGNFAHTGFGFSCMRKASELNLTGHLIYISSSDIDIYVSGSQKNIDTFFKWTKTMKETTSGKINTTNISINQLNDFKIINTL